MEQPEFSFNGAVVLAKPELGVKRVCGSCGAKFYDLARSPIVCPKCNTVYEVAPPSRAASRAAAAAAAAPVVAAVVEEEPAPVSTEVISLEEADAENTGRKAKASPADGDADIEADEDVEIEAADEDDTFLEEEEEEPGTVSDIIGEKVEGDDET